MYHKIINISTRGYSEGSRHLIPQDAFEVWAKKLHPASRIQNVRLYRALGVRDAPHSNSVTTTQPLPSPFSPRDDGGATLRLGEQPAGLKGYVECCCNIMSFMVW